MSMIVTNARASEGGEKSIILDLSGIGGSKSFGLSENVATALYADLGRILEARQEKQAGGDRERHSQRVEG